MNPLVRGWYADPDLVVFGDRYWLYPTTSRPFDEQRFFDAFSSPDLVTWTHHPRILDAERVPWARRAMWAPCAIERNGRYFLFFSANDVHPGEVGGIGVAVADTPAGPFSDLLGRPLINDFPHGAQPIDQAVFRDVDGAWYLVYGGWGHCNVARLADDFTRLVPLPDGAAVREITPEGYVEGPVMFRRDGRLYFMWSEGNWADSSYQVAYAIGDSPFGPFRRIGTLIEPDPTIATGAGHHTVLRIPGTDDWLICYHRRPAGETGANSREVCLEPLRFAADGTILPVRMTREGVPARPLV